MLARRGAGFGERRDEVGVPLGEHLVVEPGAHTRGSRLEQRLPRRLHLGRAGQLAARVHAVGDRRAVLEVAAGAEAVPVAGDVGLLAEDLPHLRVGPHVELALDALAVGVLGRGGPTAGLAEVAQHVVDGLAEHLPEPRLPGQLPAVQVQADEQRVVVEHLLEVRHQPHPIDGVAGEAAAEVVVDPAGRHGVEREGRARSSACRSPRLAAMASASMAIGCGNFGAPPRPPCSGSVARRMPVEGTVDLLGGRAARRGARPAPCDPGRPVSWSACSSEVVALRVPELVDPLAQLDEADHPAAPLLREVGAGEEGPAVGGADHGHGPAAVAGHRLRGLHVDVVDVGALLAVDLHVDEVAVHHRRHLVVLEALVGHHVAPVAGRVADRDEQRHVPVGRRLERLLTPRVPVDGVVGVLAQVRAGLVGQSVHPAHPREPTRAATAGYRPAVEISLKGKVALVTGASRGIGRAISQAYADAGASVLLTSRKLADLEAAAAEIGGDVDVLAANAGDPEQASAAVDRCIERFGGVDILVNNAATNPYMGPTMDIDLPRYDKTWEVNLRGALVWTQLAWKRSMSERPGSSVINVASVGGMTVEPSIGIYNATKAALIHLTRTLAMELSPSTRVNALAPGLVKTDMARALWEPNEERMGKVIPLGRLGEPVDIANAALFLASDLATWITGHTLIVDGGAMLGMARRS